MICSWTVSALMLYMTLARCLLCLRLRSQNAARMIVGLWARFRFHSPDIDLGLLGLCRLVRCWAFGLQVMQ